MSSKIRITRLSEIPCGNMMSNSDHLRNLGIVIGANLSHQKLILEVGTIVRIEGFSCDLASKSFPAVKISIFPEGSKMGTLYVQMEDLDGVSWEPIVEEKKEVKPSLPRLIIEIAEPTTYNNVWHPAFNKSYTSGLEMINPLALTKDDLKSKTFHKYDNTDIGNAVYKDGKNVTTYRLRFVRISIFKIETSSGIAHARLSDTLPIIGEIQIEIRTKDGIKWNTIHSASLVSLNDYFLNDYVKRVVKTYIEKLHEV